MSWQTVVERTVVALGYDLVEVERSGGGLVRVTIDRLAGDPEGEFITVDDCEKVTRQLQHLLEVEGAAYERLEVSSPGLDRPLRKEADYARFAGEPVALTLKMPFRGRKRFQGRLLAPEAEGGPWRLALVAEVEARAMASDGAAKFARRKSAPAAAKKAAPAVPAMDDAVNDASDGGAEERALEFRLDEVREARLVPVVDFKGRRLPPSGPQAAGAPPAATPTDGGGKQ